MKLLILAVISSVIADDSIMLLKLNNIFKRESDPVISQRKCIQGERVIMPFEENDDLRNFNTSYNEQPQKQPPAQQQQPKDQKKDQPKQPTGQAPKEKKKEQTKQPSTYVQIKPPKQESYAAPKKSPSKKAYQTNKKSPSKKSHKKQKKNSSPKKSKSAKKSSGGYTTLSPWQAECFNKHNEYRDQLVTADGKSVQRFKWRQDLADKAKIWADKLVEKSKASGNGIDLCHSSEMNWGHGENLYSTMNGDMSCTAATDAWFNEWPLYNNEVLPNGDFKGYGHYTQLAWPDTKYIGCAHGDNGDNIRFSVCEYDPPGNFVGERLNVFVRGKQRY